MIFLLKYLKLYKLEILTYIMIITIKNKIILWLLHNHRSNIIGNIYIYIYHEIGWDLWNIDILRYYLRTIWYSIWEYYVQWDMLY